MILPLSNGVQQLTGLGWAWQWTALGGATPTPDTQFLPRIDVYGSRGIYRRDIFGSLSPRIAVDGTDSPRLDVFGGDGTE